MSIALRSGTRSASARLAQRFVVVNGVMAIVLAMASPRAAADRPPVWRASAPAEVRFEAVAAGTRFSGGFGDVEVALAFDPARLDASSVTATVGIASLDSGNRERDDILAGALWFDPARFPHARFEAHDFEPGADGGFVARGTLFLRDASRPASIEFEFEPDGRGGGRIDGSFTVDRLEYGIGTGEWADTATIPAPVTVRVRVTGAP